MQNHRSNTKALSSVRQSCREPTTPAIMHVPDNRTQLLKVALTRSNAWTISGPQDFPTIHAVTQQARVAAAVPSQDERATRTFFFHEPLWLVRLRARLSRGVNRTPCSPDSTNRKISQHELPFVKGGSGWAAFVGNSFAPTSGPELGTSI